MDNAQVMAPDGGWFLFADWQGVTRIVLPGDKVKTDSGLDRPNENKPLVLRPDGRVWSRYAVDLDPLTLKKLRPATAEHDSPDPLGGAAIAVKGDAVVIGGATLTLHPTGEEIDLGGGADRRTYSSPTYDVHADGSLSIFAYAEDRTHAARIARTAGVSARVAWCRPALLLANGDPQMFREGDASWLGDRDHVADVAYLARVGDDGVTTASARTAAIAGPWVFEGRVWWQPDPETLCAGAALGTAERTYALPAEHAGPGRLLRVRGRKLFVPWHRTSILDLEPAKKGKGELSRKHKTAQEPMYMAAERLMRPLREALARRGVRLDWTGCVRTAKRAEPQAAFTGRSDVVTYAIRFALQDGGRAKLAPLGCTAVDSIGATSYDDILSRPATGDDVRALVAALDAAGLSRASGVPYLVSLYEPARQRKVAPPFTPDAEDLLLAAVLSGLRFEAPGPLAPATAAAIAEVEPVIGDFDKTRKAGIGNTNAGLFLAVVGHRRLGADAAAPALRAVTALNASYAKDVASLTTS